MAPAGTPRRRLWLVARAAKKANSVGHHEPVAGGHGLEVIVTEGTSWAKEGSVGDQDGSEAGIVQP